MAAKLISVAFFLTLNCEIYSHSSWVKIFILFIYLLIYFANTNISLQIQVYKYKL